MLHHSAANQQVAAISVHDSLTRIGTNTPVDRLANEHHHVKHLETLSERQACCKDQRAPGCQGLPKLSAARSSPPQMQPHGARAWLPGLVEAIGHIALCEP